MSLVDVPPFREDAEFSLPKQTIQIEDFCKPVFVSLMCALPAAGAAFANHQCIKSYRGGCFSTKYRYSTKSKVQKLGKLFTSKCTATGCLSSWTKTAIHGRMRHAR